MMSSELSITKGHFRPYQSAAIPNIAAPSGRDMRANVTPKEILVKGSSKVTASSLRVKMVEKKSNASKDHAKKPT